MGQIFRHLMFDMDNTLYPSSSAMDKGISERMRSFVADYLRVDAETAAKMRQKGLSVYGTTIEWLRTEHGLTDTDAFTEYVHPESEISELNADPELRPFLLSLSMPMSVLTNAPRIHAERVLRILGVSDLFIGIYDIESNRFKGKPHPQAYERATAKSGYGINDTLFFDDHLKYTDGYEAAGGTPVWICGKNQGQAQRAYPVLPSIYDIFSYFRRCGDGLALIQ